MPAETVQFADGVLIEVNDGAANAFAAITVTRSITPPMTDTKPVERRRLVNPGYVENIPARRVILTDCTFEYEITDALQVRLEALRAVTKNYRVTWPDGLRVAFSGWLKNAGANAMADPDEIATGTATVVVTSLLTYSDQTV
jgi:hypothetical protein